MKTFFATLLLSSFITFTHAQDTFSIVAVDSTTGEVGSAGASCVDLFQTSQTTDDFLGVLVPGVGAINTQAYYLPANQGNATNQMNLGQTPSQIIQWLTANDAQGTPEFRQYGIAAMINGSPQADAYTGTSTNDYKNHIIGPNYAIQGNILLGQEVLDSMEARFLNVDGDLACKLMAALQGANMVGADTRCTSNGTSSLFAYVKVAQPTDAIGSPSFLASVRTAGNAGIEPIDSLQTKFNALNACGNASLTENTMSEFSISPNPASDSFTIETNQLDLEYTLYSVHNIKGDLILEGALTESIEVDVSMLSSGVYYVKISSKDNLYTSKVVVE